MTDPSRMFKVLTPVDGRDGKTWWMRLGTGFENDDGSMMLYLDAFPATGKGKLYVRRFDERDIERMTSRRTEPRPGNGLPAASAGGDSDSLPF